MLAGKQYAGVDWEALGQHCSETERRADDASRDVEMWLKCYYMRDHVGESSAAPSGVVPFGLFVTLDDYRRRPGAHLRARRDYFQYDAEQHTLLGERTGKRFRRPHRGEAGARVDLTSARRKKKNSPAAKRISTWCASTWTTASPDDLAGALMSGTVLSPRRASGP